MRIGKASKCPQINTMKVLVLESFEFGGFFTWPSWSVHHGRARWHGGELCEKLKFVVFEMWGLEKAYKCLQMNTIEVFVHESFECGGFCTTAELDGLVGSFVKNWNLWFFRCEGWKGLQISPNEYHESPGARNFWVQWVLHRAKLVGAPQHS